jgi:hypothetical protein
MTDEELCKRLLDFDKVTVGDARDAALRIEALTKERDEAMQLLQTLSNMNGDLSRDMYKTKLLLAKALEALRPFAEALKGNYSHQSDALPISMGHGKDDLRWVLPLGDFRRARALLAEIGGEKT